MDDRLSLGGRRAGLAARPCLLQVSHIPPVPLVDKRAVPISLLEICTSFLERQLEGCLKDVAGGRSCRSHMLGDVVSFLVGIRNGSSHTIDICSRGERGVVGEGLSNVVICPAHVFILLSTRSVLRG
jgi:hypothetical protein